MKAHQTVVANAVKYLASFGIVVDANPLTSSTKRLKFKIIGGADLALDALDDAEFDNGEPMFEPGQTFIEKESKNYEWYENGAPDFQRCVSVKRVGESATISLFDAKAK